MKGKEAPYKGISTERRDGILENRIEQLRRERGLNQEAFAKAIRVSRQTVSSIENGRYNPSLDLAFTIADFFGLSIEEIFIHERSGCNEKK